MPDADLLSRISSHPNICFGKPCILGHHIWISMILDLLAAAETLGTILEEYVSIEREDVLACMPTVLRCQGRTGGRWKFH